jgi:hypothetical protein
MQPERILARPDRLVRAFLALALACAAGSSVVLQEVRDLWPACLFHEITGVSCMTCGLTRSLDAVSHGHIVAAMQFHLLGPFLLAGLLAVCIICSVEALTGRRTVDFLNWRWHRHVLLGGAALWVVYGVARMIAEL